jgi:hypothetical protein
MIDILVAAAILGVGGVATMILMSQNSARTRRAMEDFWAHRVAAADLGRHAPSNFATLERRFPNFDTSRKFLLGNDPKAKESGVPDSFRDSMKIDRALRFWRPASMPQIAYLESTVTYVSADGAPREVRLSRLLVQPRMYATSPLNVNPGGPPRATDASQPGGAPRDPNAPPVPDAPREKGDPSANGGTLSAGDTRIPGVGRRPGEPVEALEPEEEEDDAPPRDYVDQVTEMVHDANHRGQLAADVHKVAKTFQATAAGKSGRYDWSKIGGLSFDADYRLKLIDDVLASVPIPDGVYSYTYRDESFSVEHKEHPITIYDLAAEGGETYLLARSADREQRDAFKIEGRTAVDLGFHKLKPRGKQTRPVWARVWATRTRVYAFATRHDADGRLLPDAQELTIKTLPEAVEGTVLPQCADPRVPGWVGGVLDAIGVEPAVTVKPETPYDLRQVLGA